METFIKTYHAYLRLSHIDREQGIYAVLCNLLIFFNPYGSNVSYLESNGFMKGSND